MGLVGFPSGGTGMVAAPAVEALLFRFMLTKVKSTPETRWSTHCHSLFWKDKLVRFVMVGPLGLGGWTRATRFYEEICRGRVAKTEDTNGGNGLIWTCQQLSTSV